MSIQRRDIDRQRSGQVQHKTNLRQTIRQPCASCLRSPGVSVTPSNLPCSGTPWLNSGCTVIAFCCMYASRFVHRRLLEVHVSIALRFVVRHQHKRARVPSGLPCARLAGAPVPAELQLAGIKRAARIQHGQVRLHLFPRLLQNLAVLGHRFRFSSSSRCFRSRASVT